MVTAATARKHAAHRARLEKLAISIIDKPRTGRNKFHAVPCVYNGVTYQSSGEAEIAQSLDLKVKAGLITAWEGQRRVPLMDCVQCRARGWHPCVNAKGLTIKTIHQCRVYYKVDFWVLPVDGNSYYLEYKGGEITETTTWKNKVKQWRALVPFELRVRYANGSERVLATGSEAFTDRG